ncbi:MAG TPA: YceI family protein [Bacteroidales bacterium]|nr:YceI family protein [Bacteroidales bacterium]
MKLIIYLSAILLFAGTSHAHAQLAYKAVPQGSRIKIEGTSSLHDWDMIVKNFECDMSVVMGNPAITVQKVSFTVIASTISSHNSIMDNKTLSALKVEEYPEIRFRMTTPLKVVTQGDSFNGIASGELFIAGKTRTVSLPFSGRTISESTISISGAKKIDMTEFGIDPPTFMLGALKTGKDVTVRFDITLKQHYKEFDVSLK